jgi:cell division septation protein DedD
MFRKLILSAVLAGATLVGLDATAATADAAPLAYHRRFEVLAERHGHWANRGSFRNRWEAERVANRLRHEGFRVQIRQF